MKRKFISLLISLGATVGRLSAQPDFVLIKPVGEQRGDMPVMEPYADTAAVSRQVTGLVKNTFIKEIVAINNYVQHYLVNRGQKQKADPAYLALTQNEGGFARKGFVLRTDSGLTELPNAYYIDIVLGHIRSDPASLMSITQLFPHEMGHAFYKSLTRSDSINSNARSATVHYFSIVTNRNTAFNEGFAEHMENVSRLFESNVLVRSGVESDAQRIEEKWLHVSDCFARDFTLPARAGYFKASMLVWYQQLEDLKRYRQAMDATVRYKARQLAAGDVEDRMTYRNSGVSVQKTLRNYAQVLATEGVVSAFFTALIQTELKNKYREEKFYRMFMRDTTAVIEDVAGMISPLHNQFLKYFCVMHRYVNSDYSVRGQWTDFIEGYSAEFPEEREEVFSVFEKVTGHSFEISPPAELWVLVKGHKHRILVLDAFGAILAPDYTFDLNAAEIEDLLTIPGVTETDAQHLLAFRDQDGYFKEYKDAAQVPGLSDGAKSGLESSEFDEAYYKGMEEPDLDIASLLYKPVKALLTRSLAAFAVCMVLMTALYYRNENRSAFAWAFRAAGNLLAWTLGVALGLAASLVFSSPALVMGTLGLIAVTATVAIRRRRKLGFARPMAFILMLMLFVSWSLW